MDVLTRNSHPSRVITWSVEKRVLLLTQNPSGRLVIPGLCTEKKCSIFVISHYDMRITRGGLSSQAIGRVRFTSHHLPGSSQFARRLPYPGILEPEGSDYDFGQFLPHRVSSFVSRICRFIEGPGQTN